MEKINKKLIIALAMVITMPLCGLWYGLSTKANEVEAGENLPRGVRTFCLNEGKVFCVVFIAGYIGGIEFL